MNGPRASSRVPFGSTAPATSTPALPEPQGAHPRGRKGNTTRGTARSEGGSAKTVKVGRGAFQDRPGCFRKRPVKVEAWRVGSRFTVPQWLSDAVMAGTIRCRDFRTDQIEIDTLEGIMVASPGHWIVRGIEGELYPVRGDIFRKTYERVGDIGAKGNAA